MKGSCFPAPAAEISGRLFGGGRPPLLIRFLASHVNCQRFPKSAPNPEEQVFVLTRACKRVL